MLANSTPFKRSGSDPAFRPGQGSQGSNGEREKSAASPHLGCPAFVLEAPLTAPVRPLVLIVDDCEDFRDLLYVLLRSDYDTMSAPHGAKALELIAERMPDLVLTDLNMPCLDGFGLLKRLRQVETTRDLPVMVISAQPNSSLAAHGLGGPSLHYVQKPLNGGQLRLQLSELFRSTDWRQRRTMLAGAKEAPPAKQSVTSQGVLAGH